MEEIKLWDHQVDVSEKGIEIVKKYGIVVLSMEVRTGKTLTAFAICDKLDVKRVLMITKKKPIDSGTLHYDFKLFPRDWDIVLINYESVHKVTDTDFDAIIIDEFHALGAFPKPSQRTIKIKEIFERNKPKFTIMLSGSPTPESYSQLYHAFWVNQRYTPFEEPTFYKWAKNYVDVTQRKVAHGKMVNDYRKADIKAIEQRVNKLTLSCTQADAGFTSQVEDVIHNIEMKPITYQLCDKLKKDRVILGKNGGAIVGDTPVTLMQKMHQLYSGTVIAQDANEEPKTLLVDETKALYIRDTFAGKKMAIFYKYKAEYQLLQKHIPNLTNNIGSFEQLKEFHIALQIASGREGISLKKADVLIMFNIDFSNLSYIQGRDRLTTKNRNINQVHWLFSKRGMEKEIYKIITQKKSKFNKVWFDKWQTAEENWQKTFKSA